MRTMGFSLRSFLLAPLLALALGAVGRAADPTPGHPWEQAQSLYEATMVDFQHGGFGAIASHVPDLEAALAAAGAPVRKTIRDGQVTFVLAEGPADTLVALAGQAAAQHDAGQTGQVIAVRDPYPGVALILGSYYNEVSRSEDAVRVLTLGLTANPNDPGLVSEKGAALVALHRWPDALADYQAGLAIPNLAPLDKARLLRGKGLVLIELGRLDDAAAAYEQSLLLDPGNAIATHELGYIAHLRAGGATAPTELTAPNKPKTP